MIPNHAQQYLLELVEQSTGNIAELKSFLLHLKNNYAEDYRNSLLMSMARARTEPVLTCLMEQIETSDGFRNVNTDDMPAALNLAIQLDNVPGLKALMHMHFYTAQSKQLSLSLFSRAILNQKLDTAALLLDPEYAQDLLNQCNEQGVPLLQQCNISNQIESIHFLIENGCDIHQKDASGQTLLMRIHTDMRATPHHEVLINYLAEHGANFGPIITAYPNYLFNPFVYNQIHTFNSALKVGADLLLRHTVDYRQLTIVELLLSRNKDALNRLLNYIKELVIRKEEVRRTTINFDISERQLKQMCSCNEILVHCLNTLTAITDPQEKKIFTELKFHWLTGQAAIESEDPLFYQAILPFLKLHYPTQYIASPFIPTLFTLGMQALDHHFQQNEHRPADLQERMNYLNGLINPTGITGRIPSSMLYIYERAYFQQTKAAQLEYARRMRVYTEQAALINPLIAELEEIILGDLICARATFTQQQQRIEAASYLPIIYCLLVTLIIFCFFSAGVSSDAGNGTHFSNLEMAGIILGISIAFACVAKCLWDCCDGFSNRYIDRITHPRFKDLNPELQEKLAYAIYQLQIIGFSYRGRHSENSLDLSREQLDLIISDLEETLRSIKADLFALNPNHKNTAGEYLPTPEPYLEISLIKPEPNVDVEQGNALTQRRQYVPPNLGIMTPLLQTQSSHNVRM